MHSSNSDKFIHSLNYKQIINWYDFQCVIHFIPLIKFFRYVLGREIFKNNKKYISPSEMTQASVCQNEVNYLKFPLIPSRLASNINTVSSKCSRRHETGIFLKDYNNFIPLRSSLANTLMLFN